jgi:sirohydrochlorin cobaltochelatase
MLFAAMHAKNDIPSVLSGLGRQGGRAGRLWARAGAWTPKMVAAAAARVREALALGDAERGPVPCTRPASW